MHGLAVLGEYGEDVTFREVEGEAAYVEPGCVAVVGVPGCGGGAGWEVLVLLV